MYISIQSETAVYLLFWYLDFNLYTQNIPLHISAWLLVLHTPISVLTWKIWRRGPGGRPKSELPLQIQKWIPLQELLNAQKLELALCCIRLWYPCRWSLAILTACTVTANNCCHQRGRQCFTSRRHNYHSKANQYIRQWRWEWGWIIRGRT